MSIKIDSVDQKLTRRVEDGSPTFDVYLKLSDEPPVEWGRFFDRAWEDTIYSMKRRAWVSGQHIVIRCVPDELEKDHKPYLVNAVAQANNLIEEHKRDSHLQQQAQQQVKQKNKKQIQELGNIKF